MSGVQRSLFYWKKNKKNVEMEISTKEKHVRVELWATDIPSCQNLKHRTFFFFSSSIEILKGVLFNMKQSTNKH